MTNIIPIDDARSSRMAEVRDETVALRPELVEATGDLTSALIIEVLNRQTPGEDGWRSCSSTDIAGALFDGVTPRTVRRRLRCMEDKKLVESRPSKAPDAQPADKDYRPLVGSEATGQNDRCTGQNDRAPLRKASTPPDKMTGAPDKMTAPPSGGAPDTGQNDRCTGQNDRPPIIETTTTAVVARDGKDRQAWIADLLGDYPVFAPHLRTNTTTEIIRKLHAGPLDPDLWGDYLTEDIPAKAEKARSEKLSPGFALQCIGTRSDAQRWLDGWQKDQSDLERATDAQAEPFDGDIFDLMNEGI